MSISNNCTFIGRVTREMELKFLPGEGTAIAKSSIAVNDDYDYKNSDKTLFLEFTAWKGTAEAMAKNVKKGALVALNGRLVLEKWESQSGEKRQAHKLVIEGFKILEWGDKKDNGYENDPSAIHEQEFQSIEDMDDIPF